MGLIAGIIVGFAVFVGVNAHQVTLKHEKAMQVAFAQKMHQKELALAKARKPKPIQVAKLNGVEIADLSGDAHV